MVNNMTKNHIQSNDVATAALFIVWFSSEAPIKEDKDGKRHVRKGCGWNQTRDTAVSGP